MKGREQPAVRRSSSKGSQPLAVVPARASLELLNPLESGSLKREASGPAAASPRSTGRRPASAGRGSAPPPLRRSTADSLARRSLLDAPAVADSIAGFAAGSMGGGDGSEDEYFSEDGEASGAVSVASGCGHEGDTFLTALRRRCSADPPVGITGASGSPVPEDFQAPGMPCMSSCGNPMLTPGCSSYAGADAPGGAAATSDDGASEAGRTMSDTSSNPMLTPELSAAAPHAALEPTASLLRLINSIYGPADVHEDGGSTDGGKHDTRPATACLGMAAASAGEAAGVSGEAGGSDGSDSSAGDLCGGDSLVEALADGAGDAPLPSAASVRASAERALATGASAQHVASSTQQPQLGGTPGDEGGAAEDRPVAGDLEHRESCGSSGVGGAAGNRDTAVGVTGEAGIAKQGESSSWGAHDSSAAAPQDAGYEQAASRARATLAAAAARLEGRAALEAELSGVLASLEARAGRGGDTGETAPGEWLAAARRLIAAHKAGSGSLEGWGGPRSYDQLPISRLPREGDDPRLAEGLERIRRLDERLRDAALTALLSARESDPEAAAEGDRRRIEARAARLDAALAAERKMRMHAARLSRALTSLGSGAAVGGAPWERPNSYYQLAPGEEKLLHDVMRRDDDDLERSNPFDVAPAPPRAAPPTPRSAPSSAGFAAERSRRATGGAARQAGPRRSGGGDRGPAPRVPSRAQSCSSRASQAQSDAAREEPAALAAAPSAASAGGGSSSPPTPAAEGGAHLGSTAAAEAGDVNGGGGGGGVDPAQLRARLAEIDARLAAFVGAHDWDESGSLADFRGVLSADPSAAAAGAPQGLAAAPGGLADEQQGATGTPCGAGAAADGPRRSGRGSGGGAGAGGDRRTSCAGTEGGSAKGVGGAPGLMEGEADYLRLQRERRELEARERAIDDRLRSLRAADGPALVLSPAQLRALLAECLRQQQAEEGRRAPPAGGASAAGSRARSVAGSASGALPACGLPTASTTVA